MVKQNLSYCIGLSVLAGILQVLSVLVIAYPEHLEKVERRNLPRIVKPLLYVLNLLIQIANVFVNIGSTIYGPVAIVFPLFVSSQLLFNMVIFGMLRMEVFGKDIQVGTFVVILGSIFLPIVGPTVQQDQDIIRLISSPLALAWASFLSLGVIVSGIMCFTVINRFKVDSTPVYIILIIARVFSGVLSASLSKAFAMTSGTLLIILIVGFFVCNIVLMASIILQATKTEQKVFVPVSSCAIQILNVLTGLILWEDWRVVQSWIGYGSVLVQIIVGVYLISSLDVFENTADPSFGVRQSTNLLRLSMSGTSGINLKMSHRSSGRRSISGLIGGSVKSHKVNEAENLMEVIKQLQREYDEEEPNDITTECSFPVGPVDSSLSSSITHSKDSDLDRDDMRDGNFPNGSRHVD